MSLDEVSQTLWRERELLDLLLCKLEVEQLVLAAGKTRWLPAVTREVEYVLAEVKQVELLRAVLVDGVAQELGLGPGAALRELAEASPPPWRSILKQHRVALLATGDELRAVAQVNRDLLAQGARALEEALAWLSDTGEPRPTATYPAVAASEAAATAGAPFDGRP